MRRRKIFVNRKRYSAKKSNIFKIEDIAETVEPVTQTTQVELPTEFSKEFVKNMQELENNFVESNIYFRNTIKEKTNVFHNQFMEWNLQLHRLDAVKAGKVWKKYFTVARRLVELTESIPATRGSGKTAKDFKQIKQIDEHVKFIFEQLNITNYHILERFKTLSHIDTIITYIDYQLETIDSHITDVTKQLPKEYRDTNIVSSLKSFSVKYFESILVLGFFLYHPIYTDVVDKILQLKDNFNFSSIQSTISSLVYIYDIFFRIIGGTIIINAQKNPLFHFRIHEFSSNVAKKFLEKAMSMITVNSITGLNETLSHLWVMGYFVLWPIIHEIFTEITSIYLAIHSGFYTDTIKEYYDRIKNFRLASLNPVMMLEYLFDKLHEVLGTRIQKAFDFNFFGPTSKEVLLKEPQNQEEIIVKVDDVLKLFYKSANSFTEFLANSTKSTRRRLTIGERKKEEEDQEQKWEMFEDQLNKKDIGLFKLYNDLQEPSYPSYNVTNIFDKNNLPQNIIMYSTQLIVVFMFILYFKKYNIKQIIQDKIDGKGKTSKLKKLKKRT
jgi:hypothetical protein